MKFKIKIKYLQHTKALVNISSAKGKNNGIERHRNKACLKPTKQTLNLVALNSTS